MSEPRFVVPASEREPDGSLPPDRLAAVRAVLLARGFVLVPSDTAYSLAARLLSARTRELLNTVLGRDPLEPLSQAFADLPSVRRMIGAEPIVSALFEHFAAAPITVVCTGDRLPDAYAKHAMASQNGTIGLRIPASAEERAVASATGFPVTTVPVRDAVTGGVVISFERAIEILEPRVTAAGSPPWGAIEGSIPDRPTSTVVEVVHRDDTLRLIRQGDTRRGAVPFAAIEAVRAAARASR